VHRLNSHGWVGCGPDRAVWRVVSGDSRRVRARSRALPDQRLRPLTACEVCWRRGPEILRILVVPPLVVLYFFTNEAAHREYRSRHHVHRSRLRGFGPGLRGTAAQRTAAQGDHLSRHKLREQPLRPDHDQRQLHCETGRDAHRARNSYRSHLPDARLGRHHPSF
jgi:hypothetical protein